MQMTRMKIEIKMLRLVMGMVIMSRIGTAASVASLCVQAPPIYSPPVGPGGGVGGFHIKYDPHIFTSGRPSTFWWMSYLPRKFRNLPYLPDPKLILRNEINLVLIEILVFANRMQ